MDALAQSLPVQALGAGLSTTHDDLAVEGAPLWHQPEHVLNDLREVAGQRFAAPTGQFNLLAVA